MFWGQGKTVYPPSATLWRFEDWNCLEYDLNFCQIFIIKQKLHFSTLKWSCFFLKVLKLIGHMDEVSSPQRKSIFVNATKLSFCFWYNSLLVTWFTSVEVEIWTKVFTKKCLYVQILKTFECIFFYIARRIFGNRQLIWVIQQNVTTTLKILVAERTLYRFYTIYMTILFDLSSVSIIFVLGNSLIKTPFDAKVIRSNWKLKKNAFVQDLLALCSNNLILPQ